MDGVGSEDTRTMEEKLRPFVDAERDFVRFQEESKHDAAVKVLENVLRAEQETVKQMEGHVLSSLFERLAVGYNTLGMKYLKEGQIDMSCKFFEKAEALTDPANLHLNPESRMVLRAVTYNNFGCFYRSLGKLHTALQFLKKAQKLEERSNGKCQNQAGTHLNLCALLSQMGKHHEALEHVQRALELLEANPPEVSAGSSSESLVIVAYFNMAAEYEHLRSPVEALRSYNAAYDLCLEELGEAHALSTQVLECREQLRQRVKKKQPTR